MSELINNSAVQKTGLSAEVLFEKFREQLLKDFEMCQVQGFLSEIKNNSLEDLRSNVSSALEKIQKTSMGSYQNLLYRVDISERQIAEVLRNSETGSMETLADLIIKRILQKVILKVIYSK